MFTVAIVGLGNIGMMYDYYDPKEVYLTHVSSFFKHAKFRITHLIDPDEKKIDLAKSKYKDNSDIKFSYSISDIEGEEPDVLVLSSIQSVNVELTNKYVNNDKISLILVEKPFWNEELNTAIFQKHSNKVFVNYFRKYLPIYRKLKSEIAINKLGKPISINCLYSKGLRNNGSHLIDLICYFFELENSDFSNFNKFHEVNDYVERDKSIAFTCDLKIKNKIVPLIFQCANEKMYSVIECDLFFEKGRIKFSDFGFSIDLYEVVPDPFFPNYQNLVLSEKLKLDTQSYMLEVVNTIEEILLNPGKESLIKEYSVNSEYEVFSIINKI